MNDAVRLQNLRDCTVQIRRADNGAIVGTGVAISNDGKIVTCAHVARAAGVEPRQAEGAEVGVYFAQARGGEKKDRRARVAACFPQHDDDVVLLQLTGGPPPLAPEQIAVLGKAEDSCFHPFRSYGYRRLEDHIAGHAHGTIMGCVEPPEGRNVQAEPVQLESNQINCGMSGAAVLDVERNLIVGIVSETWFPDQSTKDQNTAWAVNARVLSFPPLGVPLQDGPLPRREAPQPKTDIEQARAAVAPAERIRWNNAPPVLAEWVGRDDLLAAITRDWTDPARHVTGLIGFGGEGKSSLARKWVDDLCSLPPSTGEGAGMGVRPDGLFWWGFYERPSVDEFFEAALDYMSGGKIDPRKVPSANVRAQIIGAMLGAGRYLFVLDGLEVMQHQDGDEYGLLKSADLRELLSYFAAPGHASFCLVTSRAPLLDLMEYTSYTHRDVDRLSAADGRALLLGLGVKSDKPGFWEKPGLLDQVVADWDGHALTLSLLAAYLVERYGGDVAHIGDIPAPTMNEPRYQRVHRVLRRYDEHLTPAERDFLKLFSAFRTPVHEGAFEKVFQKPGFLEKPGFSEMVQRLVHYRILRFDAATREYTTHPLIRNHYFALLTKGAAHGEPAVHGEPVEPDAAASFDKLRMPGPAAHGEPIEPGAEARAAHERIKDYYLEIAGSDTPRFPTLDDLKPLIEVVHHACRAGAYDEAWDVLWARIYQRDRRVIIHQLGAYETNLALMLEFFPNGDTTQDPQVSDPKPKSRILNEVGLCLMCLGRLSEAAPFYERAVAGYVAGQDWHNASVGYRNLAELHIGIGSLSASAEAAAEALALVRRAENKQDECHSLAWQAWVAHLRGDTEAASAAFAQAEALEREITPQVRYLYSQRGIHHADHLRRMGDVDYARRITEANLEFCEGYHVAMQVSQCHRVLGDLDADLTPSASLRAGPGPSPVLRQAQDGRGESAREHYDTALKIARGISDRAVLIEALLARGRWTARQAATLAKVDEPSQGLDPFADLDEALGYALAGGYRIYEADIRIALAWAHLAAANTSAAKDALRQAQAEAERARQMSAEMGYHWGIVDADEVLARVVAGLRGE